MPYITRGERDILDDRIEDLARAVAGEAYEGRLNYAITRLIVLTLPSRRYANLAAALGALEAAKQEFYRRFVAKYENEAIQRNGDIREYQRW